MKTAERREINERRSPVGVWGRGRRSSRPQNRLAWIGRDFFAGCDCEFSGGRGGTPARRLAADRAQEGASAREARRLKIRGRSPHKNGGAAATALPVGFGGGGFGATGDAEQRRRGGAGEAAHGGTWPHSGQPPSRARRKRRGTGRQTARGVAAP